MPTLPNRLRTAAQYTGLDSMRELLIEAAVALESSEPVMWQWRKKCDAWSMDKTFSSQVFATTENSEVRALFAAPQPQDRKPLTELQRISIWKSLGGSYAFDEAVRAIEAAHGIKE